MTLDGAGGGSQDRHISLLLVLLPARCVSRTKGRGVPTEIVVFGLVRSANLEKLGYNFILRNLIDFVRLVVHVAWGHTVDGGGGVGRTREVAASRLGWGSGEGVPARKPSGEASGRPAWGRSFVCEARAAAAFAFGRQREL